MAEYKKLISERLSSVPELLEKSKFIDMNAEKTYLISHLASPEDIDPNKELRLTNTGSLSMFTMPGFASRNIPYKLVFTNYAPETMALYPSLIASEKGELPAFDVYIPRECVRKVKKLATTPEAKEYLESISLKTKILSALRLKQKPIPA